MLNPEYWCSLEYGLLTKPVRLLLIEAACAQPYAFLQQRYPRLVVDDNLRYRRFVHDRTDVV